MKIFNHNLFISYIFKICSFLLFQDHVPLLAVLKPGVVSVHEDGGMTKKFFG